MLLFVVLVLISASPRIISFIASKKIELLNGRKLKIKVGDIEVEATQMKPDEVLRILELLQNQADRNLIRKMLLEAVKAEGRSDAQQRS